MTNSRDVNREIRAIIKPFLQLHGFAISTSRTFWRHRLTTVEVLNFQSFNSYNAAIMGATTHSFAVNLGAFLYAANEDPSVKLRKGQLCPEESHCHLRHRLTRGLAQPEAADSCLWYIGSDGRYLVEAVQDARHAIAEYGFPWFEVNSDPHSVLAALRSDRLSMSATGMLPGNPDSPDRNRVTGYLAWSLGQLPLALDYLTRALEQAIAIDASHAALKLRTPMPAFVTPKLQNDVSRLRALVNGKAGDL